MKDNITQKHLLKWTMTKFLVIPSIIPPNILTLSSNLFLLLKSILTNLKLMTMIRIPLIIEILIQHHCPVFRMLLKLILNTYKQQKMIISKSTVSTVQEAKKIYWKMNLKKKNLRLKVFILILVMIQNMMNNPICQSN